MRGLPCSRRHTPMLTILNAISCPLLPLAAAAPTLSLVRPSCCGSPVTQCCHCRDHPLPMPPILLLHAVHEIRPPGLPRTRSLMRATSHAPRVPASASDALASAHPSSPCRRCRQRHLRLNLSIYAPLRATPLGALQSQPDAPQRVRRAHLESRKPLSLAASRPAPASSHAECSAAAPYPARSAQLAKL